MSAQSICELIFAGDVEVIRHQIDEDPSLVYVRHSSEDVSQGQR